VDVDADDVDEMGAEAEVETDCLTSRAPSRAPSPPPSISARQQRRHAVHSDSDSVGAAVGGVAGNETGTTAGTSEMEMESTESSRIIVMPPHLDLAGVCFDPRGSWLYVASTAGIAEWGVRGGEKRWWAEAVWA
jgi:hypothetical protein